MAGTTYNAAQIVGKTLYALQSVNLTRTPFDNAKSIYTVNKGQPLGIVDTYFMPIPGRSNLWWGFKDSKGNPYYVEHKQGLFDLKQIQAQGGKDTETIIKDQEHKNESGRDFWSRQGLTVVAIIAVAYLLKEPLGKLITGK